MKSESLLGWRLGNGFFMVFACKPDKCRQQGEGRVCTANQISYSQRYYDVENGPLI